MDNSFRKAFDALLEEKQLPKEVILDAIESAMASAYRRAVNASSAQEVIGKIDLDTGEVTILAEKEVVEEVQDERTETTLEEALRFDENAELGGMVLVDSTPENFGRVAAQTARQVIQQRIREAERAVQAEYFEHQVGEIVSGVVQAVGGRRGVTVGLDMKAEGTIPHNQKIPGERFHVHDRIRCVVLEVKDTPRGPQIILSRGHGSFLRRLLENEVPEIYHGVVEIRGIAREPGRRAKVAVSAMQEGIDPVGACVGIRGVRIQNIVRELHNEKIDIIEWNPDQVAYISKAISPARVTGVYLSEPTDSTRTATVVVTEDQLSLAIGRNGQNARLAAKLTGWRIDIKSLVEATADALHKLETDSELAEMMPKAVEEAPEIEAMLAKKAEGRSLSPEEYQKMGAFMDRVERRTIEVQEEADRVEQERIAEIRAAIPPAAFEMELADSDLKEHVFNILFEAEYETVGDLMLALRLNPDKVFDLPGIGPKAIENITEVLAAIEFPEPEPKAEQEEAPAAAEEETTEEPPVEEPVAAEQEASEPEEVSPVSEETLDDVGKARLAEIRANIAPAAFEMQLIETELQERVLNILSEAGYKDVGNLMLALQFNPDQIFDLPGFGVKAIENMTEVLAGLTFPEVTEEEMLEGFSLEAEETFDPEEKKKQKKKFIKYEYDPELGEVVAKKRRKRKTDVWDDDEMDW
jgi:N utilization substance protein A